MGGAETSETQLRGGIVDESGASKIVADGRNEQREAVYSQLGLGHGHYSYGVQEQKATIGVYVVDIDTSPQGGWGVQGDWACQIYLEGAIRGGQLADRIQQ